MKLDSANFLLVGPMVNPCQGISISGKMLGGANELNLKIKGLVPILILLKSVRKLPLAVMAGLDTE